LNHPLLDGIQKFSGRQSFLFKIHLQAGIGFK
jgi:hypothetical protein